RSEGVFEADADRAAPAGVVTGDGGEHIGAGKERTVFVRGHSRTALDVEQDVVGGVADLAGEQAERIDARFVAQCRGSYEGHVAALEVGPVALSFKAEHPGTSLPAIADLATDRAARCVMATVAGDAAADRQEVPA